MSFEQCFIPACICLVANASIHREKIDECFDWMQKNVRQQMELEQMYNKQDWQLNEPNLSQTLPIRTELCCRAAHNQQLSSSCELLLFLLIIFVSCRCVNQSDFFCVRFCCIPLCISCRHRVHSFHFNFFPSFVMTKQSRKKQPQ